MLKENIWLIYILRWKRVFFDDVEVKCLDIKNSLDLDCFNILKLVLNYK